MENNNNNKQITKSNQISTIKFGNFKGREIANEIVHGVRIKNLPDDESIRQALRYVFTLTGLKPENFPSDLQKAVLIEFIQSEFATFTAEEIKIAFRMAVANEIAVDVNHFQNFSPVYFSTIMNAYRNHKRLVSIELNTAMQKLKPVDLEPTADEKLATFWRFVDAQIIPLWNEYRTNKRIDWTRIFSTNQVFSDLEKLGVMQISVDAKKQIYELAKAQIITSLENERSETRERRKEIRTIFEAINEGLNPPNLHAQIVIRARQISIEKLFKSFIDTDRDFAETVETIKQNQYE